MSVLTFWVWLAELRGLTNQTRLALLRRFETPERIYYADEEELLLTEGITRQQAALLADRDLEGARRILEDCYRLNIRILTISDAEYPARLKNIYDPPILLYIKGRMPALDEEVAVACANARPLPSDCNAAICFNNIARRFMGANVPLAKLEKM